MTDQEKLKDFSRNELLQEIRARQKMEKGLLEGLRHRAKAAQSDTEPREDLRDFDSKSLITAVRHEQRVIYGVDDRQDLFEVQLELVRKNADSVVALFKDADITDNGDGTSSLTVTNFGDDFQLCSGEPFRNQPVGAFCTGFLVAPDLIATAGHCTNPGNVTSRRFVFGFHMKDEAEAVSIVPNSEIYRGDAIVGHHLDQSGSDWALVRLDRPVSNHSPLRIRRNGRISDNQSLYVIGHPCGLPAKFAPGANVRDNEPEAFFTANLDTYGGNSGSPVFNNEHIVEGILVRGATDFVQNGNCMVSLVCPTSGCRGEDCTRTSEFAALVPEQ